MKTVWEEYRKDIKIVGWTRISAILLIGFFFGCFSVMMWLDFVFVGATETTVSDHLILKVLREDVVSKNLVYLVSNEAGSGAGGYFCFPSPYSKFYEVEVFYNGLAD